MKKEQENCASFVVAPHTVKVTATVHDKCLVKMEKALKVWVEDRNKNHVPNNSSVLCQKAWSLNENFSKGSPEMSDTKQFTASGGWLHRFRNRFGLKNIKTIGEAASPNTETAATILSIHRRAWEISSVDKGQGDYCNLNIHQGVYLLRFHRTFLS